MSLKAVLLTAVFLAASAGGASANQYAARYTPVAVAMQKTCVDYVLRKVNDGAALTQTGMAVKRQTKKKAVYQGKAGLGGAFDTVYSVDLGENNRGIRGCNLAVIRTDADTARIVFNAVLADMQRLGGKLVGTPSGGNYTYHQFAFGQTIIQVKSVYAGNALQMDYYIPR